MCTSKWRHQTTENVSNGYFKDSTITEKHTCMHAAFILKTSVEYYWHINWNCSRWMNEMNKAGQGNCPAGK